jgi:hypothetical protein
MALPRETAMQRIQVGGVGLIGVLLFVSLANLVVERSAEPENDSANMEVAGQINVDKQTAEEPLAEIGVAPTVDTDQNAKQNTRPKPLPARSQVVPSSSTNPPLQ